MKIESVFFDIDNVLYDSTGFSKKAREAGISAICRVFPEFEYGKLYETMRAVIAERGSNYPFLFDEILKRCGADGSARRDFAIAAAVKAYHDMKYSSGMLASYSGTKEALAELRKQAKLGIISNGMAVKQWDKLIRLGLEEFFNPDHVVISEREGCRKPDAKIYLEAAGRVGSRPETCAHVDDRVEYAMGARLAGMLGVHFKQGPYGKAETPSALAQISSIQEIFGLI